MAFACWAASSRRLTQVLGSFSSSQAVTPASVTSVLAAATAAMEVVATVARSAWRSRTMQKSEREVMRLSRLVAPRRVAIADIAPRRATKRARDGTGARPSVSNRCDAASPDDHPLGEQLALFEPPQGPAVEDGAEGGVGRAPGDDAREEAPDDRGHHEAVPHEAAGLVEVLDSLDRAHDRVRVGRDVVAAGPLPQHLHAPQGRARTHERRRVPAEECVGALLREARRDVFVADSADDLAARGLR